MNILRSLMPAVLAMFVVTAAGAAQSWTPPGPKVGEAFPHSLAAQDQDGRQRSLDNLMGERGVAIFFVRSADWCPFCRRQLADLNERIERFRSLGYEAVSVSVDTVELVKKFHDAATIRYPMLADPQGAIVASLGIRDPNYPVGADAYGVPQPGIFVLDRERRIIAKHFVQGYRERPDLDRVLSELGSR